MHYDVDTLDDYLHGALGLERDAVIHTHLEACAACRAAYNEAAAVRDWLRAAAQAEEREFPSIVKARVWERVRALPAAPSLADRMRALWRPMIAVPVAGVLAVFVYVGIPHAGAPSTGVAATYLLEEHAAVASDNPLADRGLIVAASVADGSRAPTLIEADGSADASQP